MNVRMKFLPILCVTLIGGCGQVSNDAFETSRFDTSHVAIADVTRSDKAMTEQAELLNDMAKGIVRASTRRGAAISATFGCGLALVAASAAKDCVAGALVGAAGGALVGQGLQRLLGSGVASSHQRRTQGGAHNLQPAGKQESERTYCDN